jgi:heme/copper-type cytochrome/quinol oxidase subunit 2
MSMITTFAGLISKSDVPNVPTGSANQVLDAGLNIAYFVAGVIAVLVVIYAGFTLVTNGSEPDGVKRAKNMLLYGVVGIIVIASAFTITWFFIGRIQ